MCAPQDFTAEWVDEQRLVESNLASYTDAWLIKLARTMYIRCMYSIFCREFTECTVMYGVYIRLWPILMINLNSSMLINVCSTSCCRRAKEPMKNPCVIFWCELSSLLSGVCACVCVVCVCVVSHFIIAGGNKGCIRITPASFSNANWSSSSLMCAPHYIVAGWMGEGCLINLI
jgi:hypothetical protein